MPTRVAAKARPAMEARAVAAIPQGDQWQYEPKWDGFRCLLARRDGQVTLTSKSGEDLSRYFPEIVDAAQALPKGDVTLDGELVVPDGDAFSFDNLLQRIHPAQSRVRKLAVETPALFLAFDILALGPRDLSIQPLLKRRPALESFAARAFRKAPLFRLSTMSRDPAVAQGWLAAAGGGCDGVIAKRLDLPYQAGNRDGMQKIKHLRSADCVIGGFRYATANGKNGREVGSLLLGLYDEAGSLHHVGFTSGIKAAERAAITKKLEKLTGGPGFTGNAPGGPSRWSTERSAQWQPLKPKLVVEVSYDHVSGGRFRHGTRLLRWRPDKAPRQCTMEQLDAPSLDPMSLLE